MAGRGVFVNRFLRFGYRLNTRGHFTQPTPTRMKPREPLTPPLTLSSKPPHLPSITSSTPLPHPTNPHSHQRIPHSHPSPVAAKHHLNNSPTDRNQQPPRTLTGQGGQRQCQSQARSEAVSFQSKDNIPHRCCNSNESLSCLHPLTHLLPDSAHEAHRILHQIRMREMGCISTVTINRYVRHEFVADSSIMPCLDEGDK